MDLCEKDKLDLEKRNVVHLNYHSSNWELSSAPHSNLSMGSVPRTRDPIGSSGSIGDPYHPNPWNDQNLAPEKGIIKRNEFPADLAFIERASRFSSFNAGSYGDIVNPFNVSGTMDLYSRAEMDTQPQAQCHFELLSATGAQGIQFQINEQNMAVRGHDIGGSGERGTAMERGKGGYVSPCDETSKECNVSYEAEGSDGGGHQVETSMLQAGGFEGQCMKKRKKPSQVMETERAERETIKDDSRPKQKNGQSPNATGKDQPKSSDGAKEDYIHVRARRGQATNSHSLAERVRREKISERMKYLQDLVPGCDKVTGKAVMLDEIINYVQSLQRQVEFLSMKLSTVVPRLDLNLEGLLTKDIHQPQGSPSMFPFPSDANMVHAQLHPFQGLIQAGIPGMGNPLDALRRSVNSQLMAMNGEGYKDSSQVPNLWDDGLNNNVFQMNFGSNGPFNGQDLSGSLPSEQMKVEF